MIIWLKQREKKSLTKKKRHGYNEDFPTDPGIKLNKPPEKIPKKKRTAIPGKHGSGSKEGPSQELPKLLRKGRK